METLFLSGTRPGRRQLSQAWTAPAAHLPALSGQVCAKLAQRGRGLPCHHHLHHGPPRPATGPQGVGRSGPGSRQSIFCSQVSSAATGSPPTWLRLRIQQHDQLPAPPALPAHPGGETAAVIPDLAALGDKGRGEGEIGRASCRERVSSPV